MPYLGYLLAQAVKAGNTIKDAISSAASFVTKVGGSVVDLSPSVEPLKSPSDGSAVFNGSGDHFTGASLNGFTSLTISGWAYYDGSKSQNMFFNSSPHSTIGVSMNRTGSNELYIYIGNGSSWLGVPAFNITGAMSANTWAYFSYTSDGTTSKVYIDGDLKGTSSHVPSGFDSVSSYIGRGTPNVQEYFSGNISNFAIWSRALSASDIRSVMNKSYDDLNASETKGLVSWYALDDISGTTVPDSHGNYNGTAN